MAAIDSTQVLSSETLFDDIGPAYEKAFSNLTPQLESIQWLISKLANQKPATIVDLGCGTGKPVCFELAKAGHHVIGVDNSSTMVSTARSNVPDATFEKADMGKYSAAPASLDAVTVYFSMIADMTQEEMRLQIERIHDWLKPGGIFVFAGLTMDANNIEVKWMGRSVVISSLSVEDLINHVQSVGFDVVHNEISTFTPKSVEAGICEVEDVWEETHIFLYAIKK